MSEVCHDASVRPAVEEAFREHRGFLWGLSYRLTGNAADADELVQETFVRALERPPSDQTRPWRPWLTRVALNLGRDVLRRRKRRRYDGPWLPGLVPTDDGGLPGEPVDPAPGPGARYDRLESVTLAFLLALEALTPAQRAVLILRDVFDYPVREAADALGMSDANVKTTHLRARRVMESYDLQRGARPTKDARGSGRALERFLNCLAQGDAAGVEAALAHDVRAVSDAGGEFVAARRVVSGARDVGQLFLGLAKKGRPVTGVRWLMLNGEAAVEVRFAGDRPRWAPRLIFQAETDADGRIVQLYTVMATCKLTAVDAGAPSDTVAP